MNRMQMELMGARNIPGSVQNAIANKINELGKEVVVDQDLRREVTQFFEQRDDILWSIQQGSLSIDEKLYKLIESRTTDTLVHAYIDQFFESNKVDDASLKNAYQQYVKGMRGIDYELSILTTKSMEDAQAATKEFLKNRCFGEVAAKHSITDTARTGGYIGWVSDSWLAPSIKEVLKKMRTKQSSDPVQAPEGFHVFYFDNARPSTPPIFEDVKLHLEIEILSKRFTDHIQMIHQQRKK